MQPENDLLRPVQQENSNAFAIMAVPDQKANSFLCQHRQMPEVSPDLKPSDAKYGSYYLSASRLNYGEETITRSSAVVGQRGRELEGCCLGCRASVTSSEARKDRSKPMQISKRTLKIAGIVVAAVVVILIALPLFINVNSFRPKIESEVTSALGRPVTLGRLEPFALRRQSRRGECQHRRRSGLQ